jgi:hypothetical protein
MAFFVLFMNKEPYKKKQGQNPGNGYGLQKKTKREKPDMSFLKSQSEQKFASSVTRRGMIKTVLHMTGMNRTRI